MMEAVFFDFSGVVSSPDREELSRLERQYGLPDDALLRTLEEIWEWQDLMVGLGSEETFSEAVFRELDALAGKPIPRTQQVWTTICEQMDEGMLDLARRVRRRYRVGMISNNSPWFEREIRDFYKIDHLFDVVVNSATLGIAKPDPRVFHHAARSLDLTPSMCVHIDDRERNVQGAREAGFHAIRYQGHLPSLVSELQRLGMEW